MSRVAVLGAGPAGLSAAKHLSARGIQADVFERSDRIGGLHRSIEHEGLHYDVGTIIFYNEHEMLSAFPALRDMVIPINYAPRSITPKGKVDMYPFTLKRFIKDNGLATTIYALSELLVSKLRYRSFQTVPEFAYYYLGKTLYERSGLKGYIHRLHGAPDEELDIEFARLRMTPISGMSFRNQLQKKIKQTRRKLSGKKVRRLNDRSARPKEGFGPFYEQVRQDLLANGTRLHLDSNVESISKSGNEFVIKVNGQEQRFDRVISTLPISIALRLCNLPTEDVTETRSLVSLFYRGKMAINAPVIFNFTPKSEWKRITIFSKFYGMPEDGDDYFTVEITGDNDSPETINQCKADFESHAREVGLLKSPPRFVGSYFSQHAYPVYRKGMRDAIERDKKRLADFGIDSIGRQGSFEYVISHYVSLAAKELIQNMKVGK